MNETGTFKLCLLTSQRNLTQLTWMFWKVCCSQVRSFHEGMPACEHDCHLIHILSATEPSKTVLAPTLLSTVFSLMREDAFYDLDNDGYIQFAQRMACLT